MKFVFLALMTLACASHGPVKLSEKAKEIEVVTLKPTGCHVMGKVVGRDENGSQELALNDALNQAADQGAEILHINQEVPNGRKMSVFATAYSCD